MADSMRDAVSQRTCWSLRTPRFAVIAVSCAGTLACEPTVVIGTRACPGASAEAGPAFEADASVSSWTTGFEDGFCDYGPPTGYCVATGGGSYSVVTSPVHSGSYAAAFTVQGVPDGGGAQARCIVQGVFPSAAYYGAWYYVPVQAQNMGNWNLFHYQGGDAGQALQYLWDVSLANGSGGGPLHPFVRDFVTGMVTDSTASPIPIGQWFHLEVYFKRAKDATGEITLWQGGAMVVHLTGLVTDPTNWGQWYVGNLADHLVPPASTVYVDDVTISLTQ
jgi:hypothetical protein